MFHSETKSSKDSQHSLSADTFSSVENHKTLKESLIGMLLYCCLLASQHLSVTKYKKQNKNALKMVSDQTLCALEIVSDQTQLHSIRLWPDPVKLEPFMLRHLCAWSRLWSVSTSAIVHSVMPCNFEREMATRALDVV